MASIDTAFVTPANAPKRIVLTIGTPRMSNAIPVASTLWISAPLLVSTPLDVFIITFPPSLSPENTSTTSRRPSSRTTT